MNPLTDPEQMAGWLGNRQTQAFRQYLQDFRARMAEAWASGQPMTPQHQAQADLLGQMAGLDCDAIRKFYGLEELNGG